MEMTTEQRKKAWIAVGVTGGLAAVLLLGQAMSPYLGAKVVPPVTNVTVGGLLKSDSLAPGQHGLEVVMKTKSGEKFQDTVIFNVTQADPYGGEVVITDPYGEGPVVPDPYGPYGPTSASAL